MEQFSLLSLDVICAVTFAFFLQLHLHLFSSPWMCIFPSTFFRIRGRPRHDSEHEKTFFPNAPKCLNMSISMLTERRREPRLTRTRLGTLLCPSTTKRPSSINSPKLGEKGTETDPSFSHRSSISGQHNAKITRVRCVCVLKCLSPC